MEFILAILIITAISLLHDGDYLSKRTCVAIGVSGLWLVNPSWLGLGAAVISSAIFWGVFRRGWQAKAELSAINGSGTLEAIVKAYPFGLGYIPMWITKIMLKHIPETPWYRRIQSGLIAILFTAPISAIPVLGALW